MYFLDTNVFLELELGSKRADECATLLRKVEGDIIKAILSDYQVDSVLVIMKYRCSPSDLKVIFLHFQGLKAGRFIFFLWLTVLGLLGLWRVLN